MFIENDLIEWDQMEQSFRDGKKLIDSKNPKFLETAFIYFCGRVAKGFSTTSASPSKSPAFPRLSTLEAFKKTDERWSKMWREAFRQRANKLNEDIIDVMQMIKQAGSKDEVEQLKLSLDAVLKSVKSQEAHLDEHQVEIVFNTIFPEDFWEKEFEGNEID